MRVVVRQKLAVMPLLWVVFLFVSCAPLIAPYNETAYQYATSIKAESLILMERATESYSVHSNEVDDLRLRLRQAYEFANGLPKNDLSTRQWEILIDPNRNQLGGFLKRWEDNGELNAVFVNEMKSEVEKAFDEIIRLESGKIQP